MKSAPVIVGIGEVLWDIYPDAAHFGGAPANFAAHAAALVGRSHLVSAVGDDLYGRRAMAIMQRQGISCEYLQLEPHRTTGSVAVSLDEQRVASYHFSADAAWDHIAWTPALGELAARCDAVCFGTLGQRGPVSRATIRRFLRATRPETLRVFDVNLRQGFHDADTILNSLEIASAVKLNESELPIVANHVGIERLDDASTIRALADRFELSLVALTLGDQGSLLYSKGEIDRHPAAATVVVDTVGAGDSFTASVVVGTLHGLSLSAINRHANAVAAYVCSRPGAAPELPPELRSAPEIAAYAR